jgi:CheY-like chemotaxis protein
VKRIVRIAEQLLEDYRILNREECEHLPTPHCLVIEDEPHDAEMSRLALEAVGVEVKVTASGDEAIRLLADSKNPLMPDYDMVFLDLVLRGSSNQGIDVLRFIRANFPKLHVVIVSGHLSRGIMDYLTQMSEGGYIGIITKPLHEMNVREILEKHGKLSALA